MWQVLFQFSVHLSFISVCLFVFVFDCIMGFQIPNQGWDPHPLHWKCGVLTTGPPGKFITLPFSDPIHFNAHKCSPCGGECSHRQLESNKRDTHHFLLVLCRINLRKVTWWVWLLTHILPLTSPWVQADYACLAYFPKIRICLSISDSAGRSSHGGGGGSALPQWRTMFPTAANRGLSRVPRGSTVKESACSAGDVGWIPGSGRSPGVGNGNPLQYFCLGNPTDRGAWQAIVHGVTKSQKWLSD